MHVLRSTYLQTYNSFIRPPYSSDPFPLNTPTFAPDPSLSPIQSQQRETGVLDLFIALKVREDVWADESELHLERDESFRDLFDLNQPRSRMEDLVRAYGVREGVVTLNPNSTTVSSSSSNGAGLVPASPTSPMSMTFSASGVKKSSRMAGSGNGNGSPAPSMRSKTTRSGPAPIPFAALSVAFSSRRVGLVLTTRERKKTIIEVARTKDDRLEVTAKKLAKELGVWLANNTIR